MYQIYPSTRSVAAPTRSVAPAVVFPVQAAEGVAR